MLKRPLSFFAAASHPRRALAQLFILALFLVPSHVLANDRYAAIVWVITSGKVLYSEDADERRYPQVELETWEFEDPTTNDVYTVEVWVPDNGHGAA